MWLGNFQQVSSNVHLYPSLSPKIFKNPSREVYLTLVLFSSTIFFLLSRSAAALDTISTNQAIKDGDTIVSNGEMYELGFFSPGKSKNRYLGIWYKRISTGTVVWVANREKPINDRCGVFEVSREGTLQILSGWQYWDLGIQFARKFVGLDNAAKTKEVVGTYTSDVFSFGVLVLGMVSGKKNREFYHEDYNDKKAWIEPIVYTDCRMHMLIRWKELFSKCLIAFILHNPIVNVILAVLVLLSSPSSKVTYLLIY